LQRLRVNPALLLLLLLLPLLLPAAMWDYLVLLLDLEEVVMWCAAYWSWQEW
jgi:hypothetical protein